MSNLKYKAQFFILETFFQGIGIMRVYYDKEIKLGEYDEMFFLFKLADINNHQVIQIIYFVLTDRFVSFNKLDFLSYLS